MDNARRILRRTFAWVVGLPCLSDVTSGPDHFACEFTRWHPGAHESKGAIWTDADHA